MQPAGSSTEEQGCLEREGPSTRLAADGQLRAQLLDDLQELQAFLKRRCSELSSSSSSRVQVLRPLMRCCSTSKPKTFMLVWFWFVLILKLHAIESHAEFVYSAQCSCTNDYQRCDILLTVGVASMASPVLKTITDCWLTSSILNLRLAGPCLQSMLVCSSIGSRI